MLNVSKEQWDEWRENPVTELLHQYLMDVSSKLSHFHAEALMGTWDLAEQERFHVRAKARLEAWSDLVNLSYENIEGFYREHE